MQVQQQQQQQPQVVVVQQPIVINGRQARTSPFLLRGYRFSSGKKFPGCCFILLLIYGSTLIGPGIGLTVVGIKADGELTRIFISIGLSFLFVGVLCFVPGVYCCCKARQEYNELPQDHPHRQKYGSGFVLPPPVILPNATTVPANSTHTSYSFTPGVQGPAGVSASFQGYPTASAPYLQGSPGAKTSYPQGPPGSTASSQMPPATNPYYHDHPDAYSEQTSLNQPAANDDLPPSYLEIEASNRK